MSASEAKPQLRFHAEYQCYPLWHSVEGGGEDNPDPRTLGLPDALAVAVMAWSDDFDARFDEDDPTAPLFTSEADEAAFDQQGLELATEVAAAVGDRWAVRYSSSSTGAVELS